MVYRRSAAVQRRLDGARAAVLAAATDLVREHGYGGCSIAAVADRAAVATGTVYRYWPSKRELFAEVFAQVCRRELAAAEAAAAEPTRAGCGVPAVVHVTAVVQTFAHRALRAPRLASALLVEPVDVAVDRARLEFRRSFEELLAGHIAAGIRAGELARQDPVVSAAAIVGGVAQVLVRPLHAAPTTPGTALPGAPDPVAELTAFISRALGGDHANHP